MAGGGASTEPKGNGVSPTDLIWLVGSVNGWADLIVVMKAFAFNILDFRHLSFSMLDLSRLLF